MARLDDQMFESVGYRLTKIFEYKIKFKTVISVMVVLYEYFYSYYFVPEVLTRDNILAINSDSLLLWQDNN